MRLSLFTLHPLVIGSSYTWWRDRAKVDEYSPPHGINQSDDYRGSPVEYVQTYGKPLRYRLDSPAAAAKGHALLAELYQQGVRDYIALPLYQARSDSYTVWILASDNDAGFSDHLLAEFEQIAAVLATVAEVLSLDSSAKALLETYLGPRSGQRVLDGQVRRGDGEVIEAALWYSDLRDFTAISEALEPNKLLKLLNDYFQCINTAVRAQGGEVMRFIGDAMLIIFPADQKRSIDQACADALAAADAAYAEVTKANVKLAELEMPSIRYGLGFGCRHGDLRQRRRPRSARLYRDGDRGESYRTVAGVDQRLRVSAARFRAFCRLVRRPTF